MAKLLIVDYGMENGSLTAHEIYDDGSTRVVKIVNGIVDYILNGKQGEVGK